MSKIKTLQVSCVQLHWAKALERNLDRILYYIRLAAAQSSRVVLFPEVSLSDPPFLGPYWEEILKAIKARVDKKPE